MACPSAEESRVPESNSRDPSRPTGLHRGEQPPHALDAGRRPAWPLPSRPPTQPFTEPGLWGPGGSQPGCRAVTPTHIQAVAQADLKGPHKPKVSCKLRNYPKLKMHRGSPISGRPGWALTMPRGGTASAGEHTRAPERAPRKSGGGPVPLRLSRESLEGIRLKTKWE